MSLNDNPICTLPVGIILEFDKPINPSQLYGGDWAYCGKGRVTVGYDPDDLDFNWVYNDTEKKFNEGGEKKHKLSYEEMPEHDHSLHSDEHSTSHTWSIHRVASPNWVNSWSELNYCMTSAGGSQSHNNMQPYKVVYRWVRVN